MGWSGGWLPLDGTIVGEPSAVSRTAEITHVFARGLGDRLWSRFYAPTQWSNWDRISPSWELFVPGRHVDGARRHPRFRAGEESSA